MIGNKAYKIEWLTKDALILQILNSPHSSPVSAFYRASLKTQGKQEIDKFFNQSHTLRVEGFPFNYENLEDIFLSSDPPPMFSGCESVPENTERKRCANEKMLDFIRNNIQYPVEAKANNIGGTVLLRCIVEKDGRLSNFEILKRIGGGCEEEAIRILKAMPNWIPGKSGGKLTKGNLIRIIVCVPVTFKKAQ